MISFTTMTQMHDSGIDIVLVGKSGENYHGKLYEDKNSTTTLSGSAIICLSNSHFTDNTWHHSVRDIYDMASIEQALNHFKERDDISHIIVLPKEALANKGIDIIDDLRRNYIHK